MFIKDLQPARALRLRPVSCSQHCQRDRQRRRGSCDNDTRPSNRNAPALTRKESPDLPASRLHASGRGKSSHVDTSCRARMADMCTALASAVTDGRPYRVGIDLFSHDEALKESMTSCDGQCCAWRLSSYCAKLFDVRGTRVSRTRNLDPVVSKNASGRLFTWSGAIPYLRGRRNLVTLAVS